MAANLKTALVTGAGSGIGRSIATTLAEIGLRVALVGRDREKLERTGPISSRARIRPSSLPAISPTGPRSKSVVDQVDAALGPIDVLVCNAGTNVRNRSLESLDPRDWDRMIATNLTGSFNLVHYVLPSMRERQEWAGDPDLLGVGHSRQHAGRGRLLGVEVRPVGAGHLPGT